MNIDVEIKKIKREWHYEDMPNSLSAFLKINITGGHILIVKRLCKKDIRLCLNLKFRYKILPAFPSGLILV